MGGRESVNAARMQYVNFFPSDKTKRVVAGVKPHKLLSFWNKNVR